MGPQSLSQPSCKTSEGKDDVVNHECTTLISMAISTAKGLTTSIPISSLVPTHPRHPSKLPLKGLKGHRSLRPAPTRSHKLLTLPDIRSLYVVHRTLMATAMNWPRRRPRRLGLHAFPALPTFRDLRSSAICTTFANKWVWPDDMEHDWTSWASMPVYWSQAQRWATAPFLSASY
jgi:hypothetical protein